MSALVRVAHVALQLQTGGMERLLVEFARCADRSRYELEFIALGSRGRVADELESAGWRVTALNAIAGVRPALVFRLARLFRDQRINVVHTHNTKPLLYAGPAARVAGVRAVVHTRHGQRHGSSPRQDLLFRLAGRCANRMVCVSDDSMARCRDEQVDARTVRIWNGVDLSRFPFAGPVSDGPAVYVGRLSAEKDVATLLRAFALVAARHHSFRLLIAGDGDHRSELVSLAASLNLANRVEFLGDVSDVPGLLRKASMFVLPSLTEGLPLTVLEAMATGLPVIATRVGGTPEAVEDGNTGLLVDPHEPEQLARAMTRVWELPELGRRMGIAGHRRVSAQFDVRDMVSRYESLYQGILGAHRRAGARAA